MALRMIAKKVPLVEVTTEPEVVVQVPPQKVLVQPESAIEAMTTEYIDLWRKFDYFEVKTMVKRMDELRKALVTHANDTMAANKPALFASANGEIEFSERGTVAEVPNPLALIQDLLVKFGPEVTATVVSIGITALRKVLSDFELKKYLVEVPGSRTVRAVRPSK